LTSSVETFLFLSMLLVVLLKLALLDLLLTGAALTLSKSLFLTTCRRPLITRLS
jgi:hypothetical protein